MNHCEFDAWTRLTERSARGWQLDEVTYANTGCWLLYRGGERGCYIYVTAVDDGANVTVGTYEDAVPHIGEAAFTPLGNRAFGDASDAFESIVSAAGFGILLMLLTGEG